MNDALQKIFEICEQNSIRCYQNFSLKKLTTFRVGGDASLYVITENIIQSNLVQKLIYEYKTNFFILGGGSNLLVSDEGFDGVVLQLSYPEKIDIIEKTIEHVILNIPSNIKSSKVAKKVSSMGYTGMEFLTTIPGCIGGAIVQNAGCYGSEVSDILLDVEVSVLGETSRIKKSDLMLSYRDSIFKRNRDYLIHNASFRLRFNDPEKIQNLILGYQEKRKQNQPAERRSAGSVFKNPSEHKAWYYIQECGLSGYSIGDAVISPKHANFIINQGNATAKNIFELIKIIQEQVYQKFSVNLELEIILLGIF